MTQMFSNGVTPYDAATFGKLLVGDTYTNGFYMAVAYRIIYDGANWVVSTTHGSKQSVGAVAPVWNAGDNRLDLTLTLTRAFTDVPCVLATPQAGSTHASDARYDVQAHATSTTAIIVRFRDLNVSLTDYVTAESTKMAFSILLYGPIN